MRIVTNTAALERWIGGVEVATTTKAACRAAGMLSSVTMSLIAADALWGRHRPTLAYHVGAVCRS